MAKVTKIKREPIMVELDAPMEGEHLLKFTMESFAEMEAKYGSVKEAVEETKTGKIEPVAFMLWAGLIYPYDDPSELSLRKVMKSIDIKDMQYYVDKLSEAMQADLPEEAQDAANPN